MQDINEIKKEWKMERKSFAYLMLGYFLSIWCLFFGFVTSNFFWVLSIGMLGATLFHHRWHFRKFKK